MKRKSAYIRRFNEPLVIEEEEIRPLDEGEALIEMKAAGVCGSEIHIWHGKDPRIKLPLIPGHEGAGIIADMKGDIKDFFTGEALHAGDAVTWERGIFCGECRFCKAPGRQFLCSNRKVYGIIGDGCYTTHITLKKGAHIIRLGADEDLTRIVPATCSGATAAHAMEEARMFEGDSVLVTGAGPLGLFCTAFAKDAGASKIFVFDVKSAMDRMRLAKDFGADEIIAVDETPSEARKKIILEKTNGEGIDVVLECSGNRNAVEESLSLASRGGRISIAGVAAPMDAIPVDFYAEIARKNVAVAGVWVSDTNHLKRAVDIIQAGKFPFERLITKTYPLEAINEALQDLENRKTIKSVVVPNP
jgi:threonine dehydrogenase-like Zn-dependent dehydrogenase